MKVVNWMIALTCFLLLVRCASVEIIPEHKATILCFNGGAGRIPKCEDCSIFTRSRYYFETQGIKLEFIGFDFPGDPEGQIARTTESHFQVIKKKVNDLRKSGHERIWLMGLSNGTISVTHAGASNIQGVKGLIVINPSRETYNFFSRRGTLVDFKKITLPILLVTHEMDNCGLKYWSKPFLRYIYPASANPEMVTFSGGRTATIIEARQFPGRYQHELRGLEKEFVQTVINFIDSNSDITEARK